MFEREAVGCHEQVRHSRVEVLKEAVWNRLQLLLKLWAQLVKMVVLVADHAKEVAQA